MISHEKAKDGSVRIKVKFAKRADAAKQYAKVYADQEDPFKDPDGSRREVKQAAQGQWHGIDVARIEIADTGNGFGAAKVFAVGEKKVDAKQDLLKQLRILQGESPPPSFARPGIVKTVTHNHRITGATTKSTQVKPLRSKPASASSDAMAMYSKSKLFQNWVFGGQLMHCTMMFFFAGVIQNAARLYTA